MTETRLAKDHKGGWVCAFSDGTQFLLQVCRKAEGGTLLISYFDEGFRQTLWVPEEFVSGEAEAGD